jgi:predicted amidohydrolase
MRYVVALAAIFLAPCLLYADPPVRVAGVVLKWVRGDKEVNWNRAKVLIAEAAKNGASIVVTTECFLDGYAIADKSIPLDTYRKLGEPIPDGEYVKRLMRLADELDIHLVAGMLESDGEDRLNTAVVIAPDGTLAGKYRKQELGHELARNKPGNESKVFATSTGKLGVMICADRTMSNLVNRFVENGADLLLCPSGGMFGPEKNDPILQRRSKETKRYIVFVHPAEFLVTAPDGSIAARTILGNQLLVAPNEVDTEADSRDVFYFEVPRE